MGPLALFINPILLHGLLRKQYIMRGSDYAGTQGLRGHRRARKALPAPLPNRVSPSALNQTIRGLEERLASGSHRTTRSVAPSEAALGCLPGSFLPSLDLDAAVADVRACATRRLACCGSTPLVRRYHHLAR